MKNYCLVFIVVCLVSANMACNTATPKENKNPAVEQTKLSLMSISNGHLGEEIKLPGMLQPYEFVQVFSKVNGFVKDIYVDRGTPVHKGQLLVQLEAPEMLQNVAAAKLKSVEASSRYQTAKDMYERLLLTSKTPGTVSPYALASAKDKMDADMAVMQAEEANYKAQEATRGYLSITAPFDGIVTERNVHPGALVGPGNSNNKPMVMLQEQDKLRLVFNIPEQYSSQINSGEVKFTINSLPGKVFTGNISRSSGYLNDKYRTEATEVDVDNKDHKLKAGMFAEILLPEKGNENAFIIPMSALVVTTEKKYVVAVKNGKAQWIDVTEGNRKQDSVEVFGTLGDGDQVIINASYEIKEGENISGRVLANK